MALKRSDEESVDTNSWMNTYSDMVTLLLAFFILLFSFSTLDAEKWRQVVDALAGNPENISQIINTGGNVSGTEFHDIYEEIKEYIEQNGLSDVIGIEKGDTYTLLRFKDNVLFDEDRSHLRTDGIDVLGEICNILTTFESHIEGITVAGHTADRYQTGQDSAFLWNLSVSRAVSVVRYMIEEKEFDPLKITASGYSKYHKIASNDTEEGRRINRRVEVFITKQPEVDEIIDTD